MTRSYEARSLGRRDELDRAAKEIVEVCKSLADVSAIFAYGSYARGNVGPHSDLDLLIVRRTDMRRALRDRDVRLAYRGAVGLDIVVVTPAEYVHVLPKTAMGRTILRDARRLDAG